MTILLYISSMLEDLFKPYDASIAVKANTAGNIKLITITCKPMDVGCSFKWLTSENLVNVMKLRVHHLMAVLFNGSRFNDDIIYDTTTLRSFVDTNYVILSPESKLDALIEFVGNTTGYDGQTIELPAPKPRYLAAMYFNNIQEWRFYLDSAIKANYITKSTIKAVTTDLTPKDITKYGLTVLGLTKYLTVSANKASNLTFVAMAFLPEMYYVYDDAIKPALLACGFTAYIVSDQHIDSDKTINDAILAGIKKARFTIADFTYHRGGVYFEAGYALGRGQKVIYTCREDEMSKAHFDIRNYQHIVWTDAEDLRVKLINKIEAFIKD